jgi:outer membrane protein assembly factor BamB
MPPEHRTGFAPLIAALLLAGPVSAARSDPGQAGWPTFKGDNARTGRGAALSLPITVEWTADLDGALYSSPAVRDGLVVLGSSAMRVYGLNLADGSRRWETALPDRVWGSAPALAGDKAYIGCVDGCVYALALGTGALLGSYCGGSAGPHGGGDILSPILVQGSRLVFGSDDDSIYGVDLGHGVSWAHRTGGILHDNGAAEAAGLVVMASHDGEVYGLGSSTGRVRWTYRAGGEFNTVPALDAKRAYVGCMDGRMLALSLGHGRLAWSYPTGKGVVSSPALGQDGSLVFGSADGSVYCLSASTGARRWAFRTNGYVLGSPLITGALVWIGSYDGELYVLDLKTGAELWSMEVPGGVYAAPAESDGVVLVAGRQGSLVCLKASAVP